MTDTLEELHLGDFDMVENRVGRDMVWGFKSFRNEHDAVVYVVELRYRLPGDPREVYLREVRVEDPHSVIRRTQPEQMLGKFLRLLTDSEYRNEVHTAFFNKE